MDSLREDEECSFFDANEHIGTMSGLHSDSNSGFDNWSESSFDVWIRSPRSVNERRIKFFDWMGDSLDRISFKNSVDEPSLEGEFSRVMETSDAVLRTQGSEEFSSSRSSMSCWSNDNLDLSEESSSRDKFVCREGNEDWGEECGVDEKLQDGEGIEGCETKVDQFVNGENSSTSEIPCVSMTSLQQVTEREMEKQNKTERMPKKAKNRWLNKLITRFLDKQVEDDSLSGNRDNSVWGNKVQRVKVHQCRKRTKELSALYKGQVIQAHEGSILTMKFSPDGRYLASAGEDGVVRVWQVVEDQMCIDLDIPEMDPSCLYFTVNHLSEVKPLVVDKVKEGNIRSPRKTSESACVIFPSKVFRLVEKPLHEFHGHTGEILDLSWSNKNFLLSSSVDKTVRMWQVGCDGCLKVFSHSNYVTCVQFNPVDDNFFISGSIDGKVRIWSISGCQVVDWIDVRDIVTAVCYRPDGQGGIVGSMTGSCRFYDMLDNQLQLGAQIRVNGKKKSPCRRITGLQFLSQDPSKVMVTCADSQVRILQGPNVIGKYKGAHNNGNQTFTSITADGKHIVSACDDANVYIWNCVHQDKNSISQSKDIRSCEHFSANASIAIPWCGLKYGNTENRQFEVPQEDLPHDLPFSLPSYFSMGHEYSSESLPKGSATWPEETLPPSSPLSMPSSIHKSQYKFLKTSCQSTFDSHVWGLVIVTAGSDGRIRSFLNYGLPVPV
ncbi:putative WD repeat-containing C3H5.08c [Gossypium arboreum]|uniref:Uncharacterized protein n=2 Tax=Gossypium arboreum TaxID=29729 RepID=A0ABR0MV53_GOSAR|nr:uncharacterized WD repeat-containing protein C18H10.05 [Gossypium arboreum]KAK5777880.1 hypothetical protein PVK06_045847 [Gossypium arboreum]KHG23923.1 putative WD repeat-containing C3H5.08c [Gossypium arboreum]